MKKTVETANTKLLHSHTLDLFISLYCCAMTMITTDNVNDVRTSQNNKLPFFLSLACTQPLYYVNLVFYCVSLQRDIAIGVRGFGTLNVVWKSEKEKI